MDPRIPTLFPIGEEIKAKIRMNPCLPRFGVIGYWPRGKYWTIFDKWFEYDESQEEYKKAELEAETYAQEKAKAGWMKCQVIFFEGLKDLI